MVEINRFTEPSEWMFVQSQDMIADLGTRHIDNLELVNQDSVWINGFDWMEKDVACFPAKSIEDIKLSNEEVTALQNENTIKYQNQINDAKEDSESQECYLIIKKNISTISRKTSQLKFRSAIYRFSNYLVDPNRRSFHTVVRIFGFVLKFIQSLKSQCFKKQQHKQHKPAVPELSDKEINLAKQYFFRKATSEVKQFLKPSQYQQITTEKDRIIYYNGRMLPTEKVTSTCEMSDVMKDLSSSTFFVPVIYKHSPSAYSTVNDVHWNSSVAKRSGVETVWRCFEDSFHHIRQGIGKKDQNSLGKVQISKKKTIEVETGPISKHNMKIAPAFYSTQTDICGPFKAYSQHHKRTTMKIWPAVFCCMTTSNTIIKVMEDYSTQSFIQSFIHFLCEVGYSKFVLIDEGSRLVKGCGDMRLSYTDIKNKLHKEKLVEFYTCPVGGHNIKLKEGSDIKKSLKKNVQNERWEMGNSFS